MSTFLAYRTNLFAASTPAGTIQSTIDGYLTAQGWQRITYDSVNFISDFIPPVSETIGDGKIRQVIRITYSTSAINVGMYDQSLGNIQGQMYRLYSATAGAVTVSATINGVLISATGTTGNTASQNLRLLYDALKSSADPSITDWVYTLIPGVGGSDSILMERKTISATLITITQSNVIGATFSDPVTAAYAPARNTGLATPGNGFTQAITLDNTNGWYLYMDIFSRSFKISSKTVTAFYGPVFAGYMPNADALAMVPSSPYCHIAEGYWGSSVAGSASAPNGAGTVLFTHAWGFTNNWYYSSSGAWNNGFVNPMGGFQGPMLQDVIAGSPSTGSSMYPLAATPGGFGQPLSVYTQLYRFSVYNAACYSNTYQTSTSPGVNMDVMTPGTMLEDVFLSTTNDQSETTCAAPLAAPTGITLQQNLDATTAYTSILLSTVTGLATAGIVLLDSEVFLYTGVSGGNTLTGVTRGYNGTPQAAHYIGDSAKQGGWFVKMNGGYIFAGLARPS